MEKWQVQDMVNHMEIVLDTKRFRYVIFYTNSIYNYVHMYFTKMLGAQWNLTFAFLL